MSERKPTQSIRATALQNMKQKARKHDYAFLSTHLFSNEKEFIHLRAVLSGKEAQLANPDDMWLYCYYTCILLSAYYEEHHYNSPEKCAEYLEMANQIEVFYTTGAFPEKLKSWQEHLSKDVTELLSTPWHLSKIRDWLGFGNICRIALTFSRLTAQEFFMSMQPWFAVIGNTLHTSLDLDELNRNINGPTPTFRALSVGLFMSRLLVNTGLTFKHTFFPTPGEEKLTPSARFFQEIKKRYPHMLNDIVWATINALTNYAQFFNISAPLATGLLGTFLMFDVSLLVYRLSEAEDNYTFMKKKYTHAHNAALSELALLLSQNKEHSERAIYLNDKLTVLKLQMIENDIEIKTTRSNFKANLIAAGLVALGFSASLLFAMPALICACYLTVVMGTALYISAETYSQYREKQLRQERIAALGHDTNIAAEETKTAWNKFVFNMIKNTAVPILIMGTLAVCWQAAVLLLVLFIAYEYTNKYMETHAKYKKHTLFNTVENSADLKADLQPAEPTDACLTNAPLSAVS